MKNKHVGFSWLKSTAVLCFYLKHLQYTKFKKNWQKLEQNIINCIKLQNWCSNLMLINNDSETYCSQVGCPRHNFYLFRFQSSECHSSFLLSSLRCNCATVRCPVPIKIITIICYTLITVSHGFQYSIWCFWRCWASYFIFFLPALLALPFPPRHHYRYFSTV